MKAEAIHHQQICTTQNSKGNSSGWNEIKWEEIQIYKRNKVQWKWEMSE
jgi:hypothetical protein